MKPTLTIFFLLLFCNVYCQEWFLNRIDTSTKFKYEYWFHYQNIDDSSSHKFEIVSGNQKSAIQLTNNKDDTVEFAIIVIKNLGNDTALSLYSDSNGMGQIQLKPGNYSITIIAIDYDRFSFNFSIKKNEFFNLHIKLGLAPELEVYQINSKEKLEEKEILSIMKCVKDNKRDFFEKCADARSYAN